MIGALHRWLYSLMGGDPKRHPFRFGPPRALRYFDVPIAVSVEPFDPELPLEQMAVFTARATHAGMRVVWMRGWEWAFPAREEDTDRIGESVVRAFEARIVKVPRRIRLAAMCDGQDVRLHADGRIDAGSLIWLMEAIGVLATWDVALAELLLALPGAELTGDAIVPAVELHPDGVRVALDGEQLTVRLGEHARPVARDRAAILRGIDAVRNAAAEARGYR